MVELLRRYSNHSGLVKPLVSLLAEVHDPTADRHETVTNTVGQTARPRWRAADQLTEVEVADLVERYQEGATLSGLTERYKISRSAVRRLLHHEGIELRHRGLSTEQIEDAVRLYRQGWSLAKIGDRMGVSAGTVHARLRECGVRMRDTQGRLR